MMKALAIIALLFGVFAIQSAQAIPQRTTYVLILGECDLATVEYVQWQIEVKTGYEEYLPTNFVVACFGGAEMKTLDKISIPLLRQVWPDDYLMFLFPPSDLEESWKLASRNGYSAGKASGFSMYEYGYAVAVLNLDKHIYPTLKPAYLIDHEMTHTCLCEEHNRVDDLVDKWYRTRTAARSRWCNVRGELVDLAG